MTGASLDLIIAGGFRRPTRPKKSGRRSGELRANPRLLVILLNNRDLNMVTWEQRVMAGDPKFPTSQEVPDFPYARYARMLELEGIEMSRPVVIAPALERGLSAKRPCVIEFYTDPEVPRAAIEQHVTSAMAAILHASDLDRTSRAAQPDVRAICKEAGMARHVSALFDDHETAASAIQLLKANQFSDREMTVVAKPDGEHAEGAGELRETAVESANGRAGTWVGSSLGAAVAGTAGLLSIALIPAVPLLMVGGAALGGGAGKLFGGADLGPRQREQLETKLRAGGVLVVVHQETEERAQLAKDLLSRSHAQDIAVSA